MSRPELTKFELQRHTAAPAGSDELGIVGVKLLLGQVPAALERMIATFKRIGQHCSPDYYYRTLRPYLFGFTDVVYRGVAAYGDQPQSFRGESGAQSTVIPTIQRLLGLEHRKGGLTEDLEAMIDYMPAPRQTVLRQAEARAIRGHVVAAADRALTQTYNDCLQGVLEFRSLHLNMARSYIASKVENPTGTGGTDFMQWLTQLRDETKEQML